MRYFIAIAAGFLVAQSAAAEITVANKCSAASGVTVANKTSKPAAGCDCAATGKCECWESQCSCSACGRGKAASVARGISIDPDHYCDKCGHYSNIVARESGGMHSHVCTNPTCRHEWWHKDPDPAAPLTTYTIPSSLSGCPNGQCPTGRAPGRLFRR